MKTQRFYYLSHSDDNVSILDRLTIPFQRLLSKSYNVVRDALALATFAPFWASYSSNKNHNGGEVYNGFKRISFFYGYHIVNLITSPIQIALEILHGLAYILSPNYERKLRSSLERLTYGILINTKSLHFELNSNQAITRRFTQKEIEQAQKNAEWAESHRKNYRTNEAVLRALYKKKMIVGAI